jgi:hypothetical protein
LLKNLGKNHLTLPSYHNHVSSSVCYVQKTSLATRGPEISPQEQTVLVLGSTRL